MTPIGAPAVRAVMIFAEDPRAAATWYAAALGGGELTVLPGPAGEFVLFMLGELEVGFHPADPQKNPPGGSPVVYWAVSSLSQARCALLAAGASPHRGPLVVDSGRSICQLRDPFGGIFGLDGPP
jgi:uncharacterized glyoxalase superfamily protein PhnB